MATSNLEQFRVADVLEWFEKKQLVLNPLFQRRSVWSAAAKSYLIDTLLRQLSMPKIYLRTKVDLKTKRSYREVVDGQQRLRAITEFANNEFALTVRAGEYAGMRYNDLDDELKEKFLGYAISVEQLINASDSDVLEVFSRLNSYTVSLNPPEKRHAEFQSEFKWVIHNSAKRWVKLWEDYQVITVKERLRMLDDSFMAEMFGVVLQGISDGGQANITKMYTRFSKAAPLSDVALNEATHKLDSTLTFAIERFDGVLRDSNLLKNSAHFLMLFAATCHALYGIPGGAIDAAMPPRPVVPEGNALEVVVQNLVAIDELISSPEPPNHLEEFWAASVSTTQRIASRRVRFPVYCRALTPQPL